MDKGKTISFYKKCWKIFQVIEEYENKNKEIHFLGFKKSLNYNAISSNISIEKLKPINAFRMCIERRIPKKERVKKCKI